jgi:A/G-specific adenine glycosylase
LDNLTSAERSWIRRRLLAWFDQYQRNLPWRRSRDPYRIWLSEIMLQQTQVATVIPYYHRFLQAFPNVQALAAADEQDVLRQWEGLGYYRRARHLHQAARYLVREHAGALPDDPQVWESLPGIGRYTLGAVLSQAYGRRLPILEANSMRVLCRLFAIADNPRQSATQRQLWELADLLVSRRRPGDFNQALMELGALVCTSTHPQCSRCPLRRRCVAAQQQRQHQLPRQGPAAATEHIDEVAVIVRRRAQVLAVQRPAAGRWANLWEFPHGAVHSGENLHAAAARVLLQSTGIRAKIESHLTTLKHGIMHFQVTIHALEAVYRGGRFRSSEHQQGRWLQPAQLAQLPLSAPQRRLAQVLLASCSAPHRTRSSRFSS